jgi:hypothetical protein
MLIVWKLRKLKISQIMKKSFFVFYMLFIANVNAQVFTVDTLNIAPTPATEQTPATEPFFEAEPTPSVEMPYILNTKKMTKENLKIIHDYRPDLYDRYINVKSKYRKVKRAGLSTVIAGAASLGISMVSLFVYMIPWMVCGDPSGNNNPRNDPNRTVFYKEPLVQISAIIGAIGICVGIPLIFVGAKKSGVRLERKIIQEYNANISTQYHSNVIFSIGATSNGTRLLLTF